MVIGKNIPQLAFLNLLLGSEPALRSDMGIYQRFMLRDEQEATRLILLRLKEASAEDVFDELLIPTLSYAKRDFLRNQLPEEDHKLVLDGVEASLGHTEKLLETIAQRQKEELELTMAEVDAPARVEVRRVNILICPAADVSDSAALTMLRQSLGSIHWNINQTAVETLTSELVACIALDPPAILCIAALPPRGLAHARYLCKRLRDSSPELQIVVGRWGQKRNCKLEREQLELAGATFVTTSLAETIQLLNSRLPLLNCEPVPSTVPATSQPLPALVSAGH